MKIKLEAKHLITPWLVEYAALVLNRFEVGKDGKTPHERCKGKKAKMLSLGPRVRRGHTLEEKARRRTSGEVDVLLE